MLSKTKKIDMKPIQLSETELQEITGGDSTTYGATLAGVGLAVVGAAIYNSSCTCCASDSSGLRRGFSGNWDGRFRSRCLVRLLTRSIWTGGGDPTASPKIHRSDKNQ